MISNDFINKLETVFLEEMVSSLKSHILRSFDVDTIEELSPNNIAHIETVVNSNSLFYRALVQIYDEWKEYQ